MTAQEAIDILKTGFDCNLPMLEPVYKLAIEALKKQIPKKPNATGTDDSDWYRCPTCGNDIARFDDDYFKQKCCDECGQKLDWN